MFRIYLLVAIRNLLNQRLSSVVNILGLAIIIACLGLFGLSSYTTVQRTCETGIRKVLGSSSGSAVLLLIRDFLIQGLQFMITTLHGRNDFTFGTGVKISAGPVPHHLPIRKLFWTDWQ